MNSIQQSKPTIEGMTVPIRPKHYGDLILAGPLRLTKGRIHEIMGDSADIFALLAASRLRGPVVWVGLGKDVGSLAPTALQHFIDPARILLTEGLTRTEILWAGEQAMRARGPTCVVVELRDGPNLRESRRMQVACEETGSLGLILIKRHAQTSAAETRWRCEALHETDMSWLLTCTKHRKGDLSNWQLTWMSNTAMEDKKTGGDNARTDWKTGSIHLATATAA